MLHVMWTMYGCDRAKVVQSLACCNPQYTNCPCGIIVGTSTNICFYYSFIIKGCNLVGCRSDVDIVFHVLSVPLFILYALVICFLTSLTCALSFLCTPPPSECVYMGRRRNIFTRISTATPTSTSGVRILGALRQEWPACAQPMQTHPTRRPQDCLQ